MQYNIMNVPVYGMYVKECSAIFVGMVWLPASIYLYELEGTQSLWLGARLFVSTSKQVIQCAQY